MGFLSKLFGGGGGGSTTSQSNIWSGQAPFLKGLYQNATAATNQIAPGVMQLGNQLTQGGLGAYNQLGMLSQVGNPFVQQQISQLGQNLGQQFQNYVLPGINSEYQLGGTAGGSRQGIAQGLAAQGFGQAFQQGATNLLADSTGQAINAAGTLGSLGGQLQQMQLMGGLGPYAMLSQILGNPAILNSSQGSTKGTTGGIFPGLGQFFGGFS